MTIEILTVSKGFAAVVRKTWPMSDLRRAQGEARLALDEALQDHRSALGRRLTIWRPPQDGLLDYSPGFLLSRPLALSGNVSLFTLPGGRAAHLQLRGAFHGLPGAWARLFEGCAAQGLRLAGLNWEVYPSDDDPPASAATDLYALLAEPGEHRPDAGEPV